MNRSKFGLQDSHYLMYEISSILFPFVNEFMLHEWIGWEEHALSSLDYFLKVRRIFLLKVKEKKDLKKCLMDGNELKGSLLTFFSYMSKRAQELDFTK